MKMAGTIGTSIVTQVAFIVKDVVASKKKFAEFLGLPVPENVDCGEYAVTQTQFMGKPAPDALCTMAFFDVGPGLQIELIEPNEAPSVWRNFLVEHGEGIHHIAFNVKGMNDKIIACENFGMKLVQKGEYGDASGCYAYLEAQDDLKCLVELLEDY